MNRDTGASADAETGSCAHAPSPSSGSRPIGFDPARIILNVGRHTLNSTALRAGIVAMKPGKGVDYFEAWDVASALLPACRLRGLNASYVADRLMQRARKGGYISHRGRGQWVRCDSDGTRSAETACPAPVPKDCQARAGTASPDLSRGTDQ